MHVLHKNTACTISLETPAINGMESSHLSKTNLMVPIQYASVIVSTSSISFVETIATCASRLKKYLIARGIESSRAHTQGKTDFVSGMPISPVRISITLSK